VKLELTAFNVIILRCVVDYWKMGKLNVLQSHFKLVEHIRSLTDVVVDHRTPKTKHGGFKDTFPEDLGHLYYVGIG